jgi:hypothetical protein
MKLSICQEGLCSLTAAIFFCITASGTAQETSPALTCSGSTSCPEPPMTIAVTGVHALGQAQVGVVSTGGMTFAIQENAEVVKSQPYQAQADTEMKQTLADGSHIAQSTKAIVARDSDGRTVRIQKLSTIGPWRSASNSPQADSPTLTTIFDPVTQTHTDYTSDSEVAHVLPMRTPPAGTTISGQMRGFAMVGPGPGAGGPGPVVFAVQRAADSDEGGINPNSKVEQIGAKTVEGISVTGTRTTTTIPAGTIGNDKDLLITRETWYSPDLKLVIQSTQTDPRFGETTYSLTNIQRYEPDAALFQVPAGYKTETLPAPPSVH